MPVPSAGPGATTLCGRLVDALPRDLRDGVARRDVTAGAQRAAAWGDPVVTLVCGTAAVTDPQATLIRVGPSSGGVVQFAVTDVEGGTAFTTSGPPVPVTITVPDAYDSTLLVPLTDPLLAIDR